MEISAHGVYFLSPSLDFRSVPSSKQTMNMTSNNFTFILDITSSLLIFDETNNVYNLCREICLHNWWDLLA